MPDDLEEFLSKMRAVVKERIREQLKRHQRINQSISFSQVVDIQIAQEKERLERLVEEYETDGKDREAEAAQCLIDDWLPKIAQEFKQG